MTSFNENRHADSSKYTGVSGHDACKFLCNQLRASLRRLEEQKAPTSVFYKPAITLCCHCQACQATRGLYRTLEEAEQGVSSDVEFAYHRESHTYAIGSDTCRTAARAYAEHFLTSADLATRLENCGSSHVQEKIGPILEQIKNAEAHLNTQFQSHLEEDTEDYLSMPLSHYLSLINISKIDHGAEHPAVEATIQKSENAGQKTPFPIWLPLVHFPPNPRDLYDYESNLIGLEHMILEDFQQRAARFSAAMHQIYLEYGKELRTLVEKLCKELDAA